MLTTALAAPEKSRQQVPFDAAHVCRSPSSHAIAVSAITPNRPCLRLPLAGMQITGASEARRSDQQQHDGSGRWATAHTMRPRRQVSVKLTERDHCAHNLG